MEGNLPEPVGPQAQGREQTPYPPAMPPSGPRDPVKELFGIIKAMLWSTSFISYLIVIILSMAIVMAMTPEIQDWIITPQQNADDPGITELPREYIFIIFPFPVLLFTLSGPGFQAWHILMLIILTGAFAYSKYELMKHWLKRRKQALVSLVIPEKAESSLEGVAKLFMATSFFSMVYFIFLELANIEMETPPFDQFSRPELIYGLFNAAVFEELISRVLLIGVPLVLIALARKWKDPARKLLGGNLDINHMTLSLIVFSAVFFALAHVGSWDFYKVPQVLVTGLALGYAFVRYGLHASIMIHFSINLSSTAMEIWPDNMIVITLLGIAFLLWIVMGAYFFFYYAKRLLEKFGVLKKPAEAAPSVGQSRPAYPPPPSGAKVSYETPPPDPDEPVQARQAPQYQPGASGFLCPNCGHTSASYEDGALKCMRCGSVFGERKNLEPEDEGPDKEMFEF